jgi:hypothetical protein
MLFSSRMISEVVQPFWAAVQRGEFITEAAESVGSYREMGGRWIAADGLSLSALAGTSPAARTPAGTPRGVGGATTVLSRLVI